MLIGIVNVRVLLDTRRLQHSYNVTRLRINLGKIFVSKELVEHVLLWHAKLVVQECMELQGWLDAHPLVEHVLHKRLA